MNQLGRIAWAVLFVGLPICAHAAQYKCVDEKTKAVTYSGTPCPSGDVRVLNIYTGPTHSGGNGMTTEEANEYYGRINRGTKAQTDQEYQEHGAVPSAATSGRGTAEQRNRLAAECARGISRSCATLKTLNGREGEGTVEPIPTNADTASRRDKLAAECERGFKKSCTALRALNGEQEKRTTVCTSSGTTQSFGGDIGAYNGVTTCR